MWWAWSRGGCWYGEGDMSRVVGGFCPAYNHITSAAGLRSPTGRPPVWRAVRLPLLWKLIRGQITHFVSPEQSSEERKKKRKRGEKKKKSLTCTHACAREQTRMCSLATAACAGQRGWMRSAGTPGKWTRFFFLSLSLGNKSVYAHSWDAAELYSYWSVRQGGRGAIIPDW